MTTALALDAIVEAAALELVNRHGLDEIEAILVDLGASKSDALKLVLFIPSAFAREHFEPKGIEFPDHYLVGQSGNYVSRLYREEPIYGCARALARRWQSHADQFNVRRILDWSAEANAVKEATAQGVVAHRMEAIHHGFED